MTKDFPAESERFVGSFRLLRPPGLAKHLDDLLAVFARLRQRAVEAPKTEQRFLVRIRQVQSRALKSEQRPSN